MKTTRNFTAPRGVIASILFAMATLPSAHAQTVNAVAGNLPLCTTMLTNCINFSERAQMAVGPGNAIPDNITQGACERMSAIAQRTGTWPANQPFGFAEACTTSGEVGNGHRRHRMFRFQHANARAIPDPAQLPNTPPIAADATHGGF